MRQYPAHHRLQVMLRPTGAAHLIRNVCATRRQHTDINVTRAMKRGEVCEHDLALVFSS